MLSRISMYSVIISATEGNTSLREQIGQLQNHLCLLIQLGPAPEKVPLPRRKIAMIKESEEDDCRIHSRHWSVLWHREIFQHAITCTGSDYNAVFRLAWIVI